MTYLLIIAYGFGLQTLTKSLSPERTMFFIGIIGYMGFAYGLEAGIFTIGSVIAGQFIAHALGLTKNI